MTKNTHCALILETLKVGDSVTPLDALRLWGCFRLGARIWDLRYGKYDGTCYDIEKLSEKNADGKGRHARYRMKQYSAPLFKAYFPLDVPPTSQRVDNSPKVETKQ